MGQLVLRFVLVFGGILALFATYQHGRTDEQQDRAVRARLGLPLPEPLIRTRAWLMERAPNQFPVRPMR
jgi:hypothetical protein